MNLNPDEEKLIKDWMYGAPAEVCSIGLGRPGLATVVSLMALGLLARRERGEAEDGPGLSILHTMINTIGVTNPAVAAVLRKSLPPSPIVNVTPPPQPRSYYGRQNLN